MSYQRLPQKGTPVQPTASHDLALQHRRAYARALDAGKAARTPLALETAQGWMDHHAKLVRMLEGRA